MAIYQHTVFPDIAALQAEAVACLASCFALQRTTPFAVMLSGGKTPLEIYARLIANGTAASSLAHVLYSDERAVPENSTENNYHHTVALLKALGIPPARVMRVNTGQPLELAAAQYQKDLQAFLSSGGSIPLGLLGIGADGHTASLFSAEDLALGRGRLAVAITRDQKPDRISVTPGLLARVERLIILATGLEKREILEKLLKHPEDVVAGQALRDARQVEIWQA